MRRLIALSVAAAVLAAAGATLAAGETRAKDTARVVAVQKRTLLAAATSYLGLTRRALVRELRGGTSLAEVATARGKSVDGLEEALVTALRARADAALAAGTITAVRAERIKARAPQLVERVVNGKPRPAARALVFRRPLAIAARFVGLTRAQLAAELRAGKSLAQVATARGKSVDGLEVALLAPVKRRVDRAVAAGRIDGTRAASLLERAEARIERLVNRTRA